MIRITTITIVAAAAIAPAAAEPEAFSYHWYKRDVYWGKFYCGGRYHPEGCETWRWRRWRAQQPQGLDEPLCHDRTEATGDQAQSEENAEALALRSWRGRVRFKYGEIYTAFEYAKDPKIVCAPSDVADTVGGKISKLAGISHWRCELSAKPCRPQPRKVEKD